MDFTKKFLAVLLATTILILESTHAAPPDCIDDKPVCMSCSQKGTCDQAGSAPTAGDKCQPGEACMMKDGTPLCMPIAKTRCNCGGKTRGCDPFDSAIPIFCISGQVIPDETLCMTPEVCTNSGQCEDPTSGGTSGNACASNSGTNLVPITPECRSGIFCKDKVAVGEPVNCSNTEFFDVVSGDCAPYPPTNRCGCGQSKCPVIGDCSKYAVCNGDTFLDEEACFETGKEKFDFTGQMCSDKASGPCLVYESCKFPNTTLTTSPATTKTPPGGGSVTTTTTPTTSTPSTSTKTTPTTTKTTTTTTKPSTCNASNVNKRYPYEGDCKKYYTCRLVSRNTYDYVPSKCVGNLVFNPANGYCDLPENVPTCVPQND